MDSCGLPAWYVTASAVWRREDARRGAKMSCWTGRGGERAYIDQLRTHVGLCAQALRSGSVLRVHTDSRRIPTHIRHILFVMTVFVSRETRVHVDESQLRSCGLMRVGGRLQPVSCVNISYSAAPAGSSSQHCMCICNVWRPHPPN